jgi:hypothetical protein
MIADFMPIFAGKCIRPILAKNCSPEAPSKRSRSGLSLFDPKARAKKMTSSQIPMDACFLFQSPVEKSGNL